MKYELSRREKILISIALGLALGIALYSLVWEPFSARAASLEEELADLEAKLTVAAAQIKDLPRLEREVADLQARAEGLNWLPLDEAGMPGFMAALRSWELETGVTVAILSTGDSGQEGRFAAYPVNLMVKGNYRGQVAFLERLAGSGRVIRVESVAMLASDTAGTIENRLAVVALGIPGSSGGGPSPGPGAGEPAVSPGAAGGGRATTPAGLGRPNPFAPIGKD